MENKARNATLALLAKRISNCSVCPSEVARAIAAGPDWRGEMPNVHAAIDLLLAEKRIRLSWKGKPLAERNGPYRISDALEN